MKTKKMNNNNKSTKTSLTDYSLSIIRNLSIFDFAIVKICLISIGMLIGVRFNSNIKKSTPFIGIVALTSYLYLITKFFTTKKSS